MTQQATCPSSIDLQQFLAGRLAVAQSEGLAAHFLHCPRCLETVHNLHAGDTLSESLRGQSGTALPNNSMLLQLMQRLKALPPAPEQTQAEVAPRAANDNDVTLDGCDFLAPAEGPGEIGRLGAYRVLKVLGQGGMGMVFEAEDARLKRHVALKVMRPSVAANPAARQRFLREAQAAAALTHDHVVTIYQVDEVGDVPFMAMQVLVGEALDERLKRAERLPMAEVLRIGRETAEGLAAAHEAGLIHRDIKPGNLWLESPRGRVKILDFGLARVAADNAQLTQSGAIVGTPAYMAPEQARGDTIDGRCDLFSLGSVLYRLATGQPAFRGSDTMSTLLALATDRPTPPRQLNPDIPKPLSDLILQLLAKNPDERPASARIVAERLSAIAQGPFGAARAVPPSRRRWLAVTAAAAFLAGLIALTVIIIRDKQGKEVARYPVPDGGSVEVKDGEGKKPAPAVKKSSADDERRAAKWVLSLGGSIHIRAADKEQEVKAGGDLPGGEWRLERIKLESNQQVSDAGLAHLQGLTSLKQLSLDRSQQVSDAGLEHLKDLTSLEDLNLAFTGASAVGLKHLKGLTNLKRLNLQNTRVGDVGLEHLKGLTSLHWLMLQGTPVSDAGLVHLGRMTNLQEIFLTQTQVGDAGLENLKGLTSLVTLYLGQTQVGDAGLVHLKPLTHLACLDLGNPRISDAGVEQLKGLTNLEALHLVNTQVSDAGLVHLERLNKLSYLHLGNTRVGDAGLKHLQKLGGLHCLDLYGTRVSDAGLTELASLPAPTQLVLTNTRISAKGIAALRAALPGCPLMFWSEPNRTAAEAVLALGGTVHVRADGRADDRLVKTVAELPSGYFRLTRVNLAGVAKPLGDLPPKLGVLSDPDFDQLQTLDLSGTLANDGDLSSLRPVTSLTDLSLARTKVSDNGLSSLKECKHLRRLVLDGTPIGGFGLEHLKALPALVELRLGCPSLLDLALPCLGELKRLEKLSLAGSGVNDADLKALHGLERLRELDLSDTKATEAGVAELRKALPKCKIVFGPAAKGNIP